jgi:hypothetical protein
MNPTDARPTPDPTPTVPPAAPGPLSTVTSVYRHYRPECWVTLALAAAVALIAASQHRPEQQRVEPPPPVDVGSHAQR